MSWVVLDSGNPIDDHRDTRECPEAGLETVRPCPATQRGIHTGQLSRVKPRFPASPSCAFQALGAAAPEPRIPPAHTLAGYAKRSCDRRLCLAGLEQASCLGAALFHPMEVPPWSRDRPCDAHIPEMLSLGSRGVTLLCEAQ